MIATPLQQRILDAVDQLPPDATIEDVIERLRLVAKVERDIAQNAGQLVLHEEIIKQSAPSPC